MSLLAGPLRHLLFVGAATLCALLVACEGGTPTPIVPMYPTVPSLRTLTPITPVISQTLNGITMGIAPVYADAHRIAMAFSLSATAKPYSRQLESWWGEVGQFYEAALALRGTDLPAISNSFGPYARAGETIETQGTLVFDASKLQSLGYPGQAGANLPLQLDVPVYVNNRPSWPGPLGPVPTSLPGITPTPTQIPPPSHVLTFTFSLDVPFDSRRIVIAHNQAISATGMSMLLKDVVITASEARVNLQYSLLPDHFPPGWPCWDAYATMKMDSRTPGGRTELVAEPDAAELGGPAVGDLIFTFPEPGLMDNAPVECELIVTAGAGGPHCSSNTPPLTWTFHFTVPLASQGR